MPRRADPVLLVIAFRLAFLDDLEPLHAGFRHECLIHTPLFAGFPGFRSKLWLGDDGHADLPWRVPVGRSDGRGRLCGADGRIARAVLEPRNCAVPRRAGVAPSGLSCATRT